jgi:hypothetical protein
MATLIGDTTQTYTNADSNPGGVVEAYKFTCLTSGTVDTLHWYSTLIADTNITDVYLAIYGSAAGDATPAISTLPLTTGEYVGKPPAATWITATVSLAVTAGTIYWLAFDAIGSSGSVYYDVAQASSGGTAVCDGVTNFVLATPGATTWQAAAMVGPMGFYGTGTPSASAALTPVRDFPQRTFGPF